MENQNEPNMEALEAKRKLNLLFLRTMGYKDIQWIPLGMTAKEYIEYKHISELVIPKMEMLQEIRMACERLNFRDYKFQALAIARLQVATEKLIVETVQEKILKRRKDILLARRIGGSNIFKF